MNIIMVARRRDYDEKFIADARMDFQESLRNRQHIIRDKIIFVCPIHGEYEQNIWHHLHDHGCPKCGHLKASAKRKANQCSGGNKRRKEYDEAFLAEVREDYREGLINKEFTIKNKIVFVCPEHGEYSQAIYSHLLGHGCPKCGRIKRRASINAKRFTEKVNQLIHSDYDSLS